MTDASRSEYAVIGGICVDLSVLDKVAAILNPTDFTSANCAAVYAEAVNNREHFDANTAASVLVPKLGKDGAGRFVMDCMDLAPTTVNMEYHARQVHEAARFRAIQSELSTALMQCPDTQTLADAAAGIAHKYLQEDNGTGTDMLSALVKLMDGLGHRDDTKLYTGFHRLDEKLKGLRPGQLIIVGARPGVGKSAFLLNLALNVARVGKVVMFSMEMTADEIAQRGIVTGTQLPLDAFLDDRVDKSNAAQVAESAGEISRLHPIIIDDRPALTIEQLRARVRLHPDTRLVVVDYLQLMQTAGKHDGRNWELGELSRELKNFAVEAGVPIVVAAQLNRGVDDSDRPSLRSIRDSGEIEANASKVLLMWRSDAFVAVDVAKNRLGRTGVVMFDFNGEHMRFTETDAEYAPPARSRRDNGFMEQP